MSEGSGRQAGGKLPPRPWWHGCSRTLGAFFFLTWLSEEAQVALLPPEALPCARRGCCQAGEAVAKYEEESGAGWRQLLSPTPKLAL